ncbi:hypothetical protein BKP35_04655 [Anaerobacillus arseniciselenatis]|uniref:Uncharacterized protein n=1 Tax=Anaerobacillus arseniciselenatis TaxID=85682 RepID=A0A1S2LU00_9BACI|nr:hypothetical protein [Anaerobacillus arseniciselenatis]OIJ15147.1 hypothetical protein BKP35_04655 [Anaerobacillus arseniciselenatis]
MFFLLIEFTFLDPEGNIIFNQDVHEGTEYSEIIEEDFPKGIYDLKNSSKNVRGVELVIELYTDFQ